MTWLIVLGVVVWLICAVLAYGMDFAHFMNAYKYINKDPLAVRQAMASGAAMGLLCGPLGLLIIFLFTGFAYHGIRFRP